MNPLKELSGLGQSLWYDNIERRLLQSGQLDKLIVDCSIRGVTTNPTIFEKAISKSQEYDAQIKELTRQGKNTYEIYDELTVFDVGMAADILREVYRESNGRDGYVSIEALPEYAHKAKETVDYARRIFKKINRPNIMVKVPGTPESLQAIRTLIGEGINVNVTLLFSTEHYERIARAYIDGLRDRMERGKDLSGVCSVASIFVSRIDTKVDKILQEKGHGYDTGDLRGAVAVANSRMIYQLFKKIFSPGNFGPLKEKGAKVQRVLWASTSTKNPDYSDVKYVEELIGKDTVNTLPPETVLAFRDHGRPRLSLEEDLGAQEQKIKQCGQLGIDLIDTCQQIQDAGVKAFQDSFDRVIQAIRDKAQG